MTVLRQNLTAVLDSFNVNFVGNQTNQTLISMGLPPKGYGLWVIAVVWVMKHFSLRTNSVDSKRYGI